MVHINVEKENSNLLAVDDLPYVNGGLCILPQVSLLLKYEAFSTFSTKL